MTRQSASMERGILGGEEWMDLPVTAGLEEGTRVPPLRGHTKTVGRVLLALAAFVAFVLVVAPRVFDLTADPADYWPFGTAWGDEGPWNYPSAYASLTGRWPDLPPPFHATVPVYAALQRVVFHWTGPGLIPARLLSVVCGVLTAALIAGMFRPYGVGWAVAAAALYGSDFWAISVNRLATPESLCVLLLTSAGCLLCLPEAPGSFHRVAACALALLSALSKPPAAFGLAVVLLFVAAQWPGASGGESLPRSRWVRRGVVLLVIGAFLLSARMLAIWAGEGVMVQLRRATSDAGGPVPFALDRLATLFRVPLYYPFAVHHSVPILGASFLIPVGLRELAGLRRRLALFAILWLSVWWVVVPFTNFRNFRYAFLTVPVTVLGVLGFQHWAEASMAGGRLRRRGALAVFAAWFLALWSLWLSDLTGLRARVWYPLLLLAALTLAAASGRLGRPRASRGVGGRVVGLLVSAVLAQAAVFTFWAGGRTHLIVTAQRAVADLPLGSRVLCGQEAPSLLLASPLNGRPLYYHWNPSCRYNGHRADLVLVPRALECARAAYYPFFAVNHERLLELPELGRVRVWQWDGPRKLVCELSLSVLGEFWNADEAGGKASR
jgi:hypothetical protein